MTDADIIDTDETDQPAAIAIRTAEQNALEAAPPVDWLAIEDRVRTLYAPGVDDTEWEIYKREAQEYDLSPIKREYIPLMIGNIEEKDDRGQSYSPRRFKKQYRGYVTQAGMIALAERTGRLDAIDGPYWIGEKSSHQWIEYWLKEWGAPEAARVTVYRTDKTRPTSAVVTMSRARTKMAYDSSGNSLNRKEIAKGPWTDDPAMMLGVRATTDALRKSGLLTAIPAADPLTLAIAAGKTLELEAGAIEAAEHTQNANRRLHAIANTRGMDHDDVRIIAEQINPGTESIGALDDQELHATADYIDQEPAEHLAEATGKHVSEITGEHRVIAPEPDAAPADGTQTDKQREWLDNAADRIDWRRVSDATAADYANREILSYTEAERLIHELDPAIDDDNTEWSRFWIEARAAGFKTSRSITAVNGEPMPDTPDAARQWLADAIAAQTKPAE